MSITVLTRSVLLLSTTAWLSACALFPRDTPVVDEAGRLVAQDFVNVLQQVEGLTPESTVLDFRPVTSAGGDFADNLEKTLQDAGYAIREAGKGASDYPVTYSIVRKTDSASGQMMTYTLSVGDVSMRRSYRPTENGRVAPMAAMQVKGIDASRLHMNDSIFEPAVRPDRNDAGLMVKNVDTDPASVRSTALSGNNGGTRSSQETDVIVSAAERPRAEALAANEASMQGDLRSPKQADSGKPASMAIIEAPTRELASDNRLVDIAAPSIARSFGSNSTGVFDGLAALSKKPTRNMRDIGQSNFEDTLNDFSLVKEAVLTFGDDSLRLGDVNKSRVQQFVEVFAEESDVFSIIGCSHGPTKREIGQQGLALGRAKRVRDELLFSGVPEERILDEGCWANEAFDERFPRRGVVLSLLRPTA